MDSDRESNLLFSKYVEFCIPEAWAGSECINLNHYNIFKFNKSKHHPLFPCSEDVLLYKFSIIMYKQTSR